MPKKEIGRVFKSIKHLLENQTVENINVEGYASRFGAQLNIPQPQIRQVRELLAAEKKMLLLEGRSPTSIVAACLYAVTGLHKRIEEYKLNEKARAENPKAPYVTLQPTVTATNIGKVRLPRIWADLFVLTRLNRFAVVLSRRSKTLTR